MNANLNNPDAFVSSLRQTTINNGGASYWFKPSFRAGENPGKGRYIVGGIGPAFAVSHAELYRGGATIKNRLFGRNGRSGYIDLWREIVGCEGFGAWTDSKTGETWFDPILTVDNIRQALEIATELKQIAIYDQVDDVTINVNGETK